MGFYWWYDKPKFYESKRSGSRRGAEYIPVEEKVGFWRNFGWPVAGSLFWFFASIFVLWSGWNGWLNIGGTLYYGFVFTALAVSAVYPIYCWQQYRILQRACQGLDLPIMGASSEPTSPDHR